jgi:tetrahydromethanopterin S-methyltransferase subunit A
MEDPALAHLVSHKRQINELIEKITAIMVAAERVYDENDKDDGVISEQILVSLIPKNVNERWEEPSTVIPVGAKWAVVYKDTVRPVGEKLHSQATHAYRACRRLNAAYWENEAHAETEAN